MDPASPASLGPPPGAGLRVAMVAAERSGDQLAALLLQGMRQRWGGLQASGIGGPLMQAQGFVAHHSCDELTVRGLVEGLWAYRRISAIRRRYAADSVTGNDCPAASAANTFCWCSGTG